MFDALLSKFKKGSAKEVAKSKKPAASQGEAKSDNVLLFGSIGLIILGISAIAFEAVTSSNISTPQQTVIAKPAAKPATPKPVLPASAPTATSPASAPAPADVRKEGVKLKQ